MESNMCIWFRVAYPLSGVHTMRQIILHRSWVVVLIFSFSSIGLAQNALEVRELAQGKPVERQLAGGETDVYSIQVSTGHFLSVIVDQRGIDVAVTLLGPDGKQIEAIDSPNGTTGPE